MDMIPFQPLDLPGLDFHHSDGSGGFNHKQAHLEKLNQAFIVLPELFLIL